GFAVAEAERTVLAGFMSRPREVGLYPHYQQVGMQFLQVDDGAVVAALAELGDFLGSHAGIPLANRVGGMAGNRSGCGHYRTPRGSLHFECEGGMAALVLLAGQAK